MQSHIMLPILAFALVLPGSLAQAKPVYRHLAHDVEFNPATGLVSGRAVLEVEAVDASVAQLGVYMDRGLSFQS